MSDDAQTHAGGPAQPAAGSLSVPLSRYPGMNRFVLDWIEGGETATSFLPRSREALIPRGKKQLPFDRNDLARELVESNRRWGSFVSREVEHWLDGSSVVLVAGQQVGFAGGPLYTLAKIAGLVKTKRKLEARGVPATIFFWLATEDHDYDEAATLQIPVSLLPREKPGINRQLDLLTLRATRSVDSRAIVGPLPIPEALIGQLLMLQDMERPAWLRRGVTFRDSFAELLATVFERERIVFVDALLPSLRRAGAALFDRMIVSGEKLQDALELQSAALRAAGYTPQVTPRPDGRYTLLFRVGADGERRIIEPGEEAGDAATISTSALTRPLLQDYAIRPDVFMGGPAEVAYYAQIAPLYPLLGVPQPRVALRGHALVASARVVSLFAKHSIEPAEVFQNADSLLVEKERGGVDEIRSIAEKARAELSERLTAIGEIALPAEHALAGAIARSTGHIEYHFEKLTDRAIRSLVRKDRDRHAAARTLVATFFPDAHVQDRVVSWFSWWCRYGAHLVDRAVDEIEPDSGEFRIVPL